jgi:hypothetical protein
LVLAVSGSALATGIPFDEPWGGPVFGHIRNKAMGSVYTGTFVDGNAAPIGVYLQPGGGVGGDGNTYPALVKLSPTGGEGSEDGWGVFQIDTIWKGDMVGTNNIDAIDITNPLYNITDAAQTVEIIGMYYDRMDTLVRFNDDDSNGVWDLGDDSQDIEFVGDQVEIFAQSKNTFRDLTRAFLSDPNADGGDAGSSARLPGVDHYIGIGYDANGNPIAGATQVLTLAGEPGYWGTDPNTEGLADFTPEGTSGTGDVDIFYSVTGGTEAARWDTGAFIPQKIGNFLNADFRLHVTDSAVTQDPNFDWLVTSSDPLTAVVIPEPLTMLAVGLGIGGLAGYVRRRRRRS